LLAFCGKNTDLPFSSLKNERKWVGNSKPVIPGQKPNESLKADHPPPGFFGSVLSFVAAGVGLAQALGLRKRSSWKITYQ
jgi:hypothetical protein